MLFEQKLSIYNSFYKDKGAAAPSGHVLDCIMPKINL